MKEENEIVGLKLNIQKTKIMTSDPISFRIEYITWNARLDEVQAGIKIDGRNINNLRYADDTMLMAESEEELKAS